jgi:hypothetical protein
MLDFSSFQFSAGGLIASVFWGALAVGFFIYGKKQSSAPALFGGLALFAISFLLANSALWMSLAGVAILVGIYYWSQQND